MLEVSKRKFGNFSGKNLSLKECKILQCDTHSADKSCAIVVPVYEEAPDMYERASFINMKNVIDGRYDIILLHGKSFNPSWYKKMCECHEMVVDDVFLSSRGTYSDLCENFLFYKTLSEYKYILIYQLDAWIFKNNIQYFIQKGYDYIGSIHTFSKKSFSVGNGGFSLRKVSSFAKACVENKDKLFPKSFPEDIVFSYCLSSSLKIAPFAIGIKFGFQNSPRTLFTRNGNKLPMGCHAFRACDYRWWKNYINVAKVLKDEENKPFRKMRERLTKHQENKILSFAKRINANIENPVTIADKLNWLKLYDCTPLKTKCADKLRLHEYAKEKLGKDICPNVLKVYNSASEVDFKELPDKFVLKCNHGSGMNIVVSDKKAMNVQLIKAKLNTWLKTDFSEMFGEAHYHDIVRKCYAEEYMGNDLIDYKFWCFNGEPRFFTIGGGGGHGAINHYDLNGNYLGNLSRPDYPSDPNKKYSMPNNLEEMLDYARILSKDFYFVRVDFYEVEGKTILGELTFIPGAGNVKYKHKESEKIVGKMLRLPIHKSEKIGVVYTCITGNYEAIQGLSVKSPHFDYVCYTDQKTTSDFWEIRPIPESVKKYDNKRINRYIKLHPHEFFPEYGISVYIDGNVDIRGDLENYLNTNCRDNSISLFIGKHPKRDCIYDEAKEVVKIKKDTADNVDPQIERYEKEGFPKKFGLTQNCIVIRRHNDRKCIETMNVWWNEVLNGSYRDQLSLFYALWKTGNKSYKILPKDIFKCQCFIWETSHRKSGSTRKPSEVKPDDSVTAFLGYDLEMKDKSYGKPKPVQKQIKTEHKQGIGYNNITATNPVIRRKLISKKLKAFVNG